MYRHKRVLLLFGAAFLAAAGTLLLLALLGGAFPVHASPSALDRYVATDGWDIGMIFDNNCSDPTDPCLTVQYAVDVADPGDGIKVAAGTYSGVGSRPAPAGYPNPSASGLVTQVVYISKTVVVRGGYTTTNNFAGPPNPVANPTTLDAEGQGRVLVIAGDITPTVEGLHITNGDPAGLGGSGGGHVGGGIYVLNARATISENQIASNTSGHGGGGVALYWSPATLSGNTIVSNTGNYGGGLLLGSSGATIDRNTIAANNAKQAGGGLYLYASAATLSGNTVFSNTAVIQGGGLRLYESDGAALTGNRIYDNKADRGGGIELCYSDNVTLMGNQIYSNTAGGGGGGGLCIQDSDNATLGGNTVMSNTSVAAGGGLCIQDSDNGTLSENTIFSNTAGYGGGLYLENSSATLNGNTVFSNTARVSGGGLHLSDSDATLNGNTVVFNIASGTAPWEGGGGLYLYNSDATLTNTVVVNNQTGERGGGLHIEASSPRLLHTTIARNSGGDGSGVYVTNAALDYSTVWLTNTILVSQMLGVYVDTGNAATLNGVLWYSNTTANTGGAGFITVTNALTGNPAFAADGYHLATGSAAIDQGVDAGVTTDVDGEIRQGLPDLGADEFIIAVYLPLVLKNSP